jgi:NADPH-dependent glutamate synthase beta subunit-like oxidoreductase
VLSLVIRDATGRPIDIALCRLRPLDAPAIVLEATTDKNGRVDFLFSGPARAHVLHAPGRGTAPVAETPLTQEITLGGDCANGGREVVNAAAEGKAAARAIGRDLEEARPDA